MLGYTFFLENVRVLWDDYSMCVFLTHLLLLIYEVVNYTQFFNVTLKRDTCKLYNKQEAVSNLMKIEASSSESREDALVSEQIQNLVAHK